MCMGDIRIYSVCTTNDTLERQVASNHIESYAEENALTLNASKYIKL